MKRLPTLTNAQRRALLVVEWVLLIGIIALAIFKNTPPRAAAPFRAIL